MMFSLMTALVSPRVMQTLESRKELLLHTLQERAGVLCVEPSPGTCLLQGEWECMKKAYVVLEEFCLQVQAQSAVQALLKKDHSRDEDSDAERDHVRQVIQRAEQRQDSESQESGASKSEVYPDSTRPPSYPTQGGHSRNVSEASGSQDSDTDSDHGLKIVIPEEDDDDDDDKMETSTPRSMASQVYDLSHRVATSSYATDVPRLMMGQYAQSYPTPLPPIQDLRKKLDSHYIPGSSSHNFGKDGYEVKADVPQMNPWGPMGPIDPSVTADTMIGISRTPIFPMKFKQQIAAIRSATSNVYYRRQDSQQMPEWSPDRDNKPQVPSVRSPDDNKPASSTDTATDLSVSHKGMSIKDEVEPPTLVIQPNERSTLTSPYGPDPTGTTPVSKAYSSDSEPPPPQLSPQGDQSGSAQQQQPQSSQQQPQQAGSSTSGNFGNAVSCPRCGVMFPSLETLREHILAAHPQGLIYTCQVCDKQFTTRENCQRHMLVHAGEMHCCPVCGKSYKSAQRLREHIMQHDKNYVRPSYPCPVCGKTFTYRHNMQVHLMRIHKGKTPTKKHECHVCGQKFLKPVYLRTHMMRHGDQQQQQFPDTQQQ